jgi:hypothetical protein
MKAQFETGPFLFSKGKQAAAAVRILFDRRNGRGADLTVIPRFPVWLMRLPLWMSRSRNSHVSHA